MAAILKCEEAAGKQANLPASAPKVKSLCSYASFIQSTATLVVSTGNLEIHQQTSVTYRAYDITTKQCEHPPLLEYSHGQHPWYD